MTTRNNPEQKQNDPPVVADASPANSQLPELEVFRSGDHTTSAGDRLSFSSSDLDATVAAYDAAAAPTPIVVGHPKTDDPAYGQIAAFKRVGSKLIAEPAKVDAAFAALVKDGKYNKISIAFFPPTHPSNPKPGVWYPRHVGFLGAAAPAVTGLKPVTFSDEQGVIEFAMDASARWTLARVMRTFRDFLIENFGMEDANKVISDYDVTAAVESAARADERDRIEHEQNQPLFNAPDRAQPPAAQDAPAANDNATPGATPAEQLPEETMSEQDKQELERLRAENASLKTQQEQQAADARRADFSALADKLVGEGRLLPADKDGFVAFAAALPADENAVEFSAADGTKSQTSLMQWFKNFAARLPVQVPQGEAGAAANPDAPVTAEFTAPPGMSADADGLALHNKALAHAKAHNVDYLDAVKAVGGK